MPYNFDPSRIITFDSRGTTVLPGGLTVLGLASAGFVKADANGKFYIDVSGGGSVGQTTYGLTFNNSGTGSLSGASFDGSVALTVSYNTIGAQPLSTNLTSLAGLTYTSTAFVKMTGAGTFVLDTSGGTQTLQQVTSAGNDTSNTIILKNPTDNTKFFEIRVLSNGNILFDSSGTASLHCTGDIVAFSDGTGGGTGSPGSYGAGHVIAKQLVPFAQREVLSFSEQFSVTDDIVNNATLIAVDTNNLSLPLSQITGVNLQTVTNAGSSTYNPIYLTYQQDQTKLFEIKVLSNGNILFSGLGGASLHCTGDIVAFSDGTGGGTGTGSGYGSGHVIARLLVPFTQREKLSFAGIFSVTDDAVNNATLVDLNLNNISLPTSQITGLNLQAVTDGGNVTNDPIILTNTAGTQQVSISVNSNGDVILTAGTSKNFHFSGDVIAFSSASPPPSSWWEDLPIATPTSLGGVRIGTGLTIDLDGILSLDGGTIGQTTYPLTFNASGSGDASGTTFNGTVSKTISYNTVGAAAATHTHAISDVTNLQTTLDTKLTGTSSSGNVAYWSSTTAALAGDARFFWDATNKKLRLQSPDQSKSFTIEINNDGNIIFTSGVNQNFHFSGDVIAFSSLTPPVSTWWEEGLPIATATTLGGIKVGSGLTITNGVLSSTGGSSAVWGNITGTLSNQTDLQTALNTKEPVITAGTTSQYWRGDKSWQTLNTTAVTEGSNLYYTDTRARASVSLTVIGSSGSATYNSSTGIFNIPTYTLTGLGGEPAISAGTTSQYWRGDKSWQTFNLQNLTSVGNSTNQGIVLTNTAGTKSVTVTVDTNGNILFNAGLDQNFHFTGDVVAFSSMSPPATSWWSNMPYATATTVGGIKVGSGLAIDGSGVLSVTGAGVGSVTSVGLAAPTGFTVTNTPITSSGNLTLSFTSGYSLPTTASQTNWDTAFSWGNHASAGYQLTSQKGVANGYASLDAGGKVPVSQLPSSLMEYKGVWNATTNSPSLTDGTGDTGDVYRVSVGGTRNLGSGSITFDVGDYIIYNGTIWEKSDTTDAVASVFGRTGIVTAQNGDYTTAQVTESGNLYYTDTRARSAISVTNIGNSGAASYTSSTGVFNIPEYTLFGLGGFANPMTSLGDLIIGGASGTPLRLAGNITTGKQYLSQTGNGSTSADPTWATIAGSDVTGAALTKTDDTNVTITLGGSASTSLLRAASLTLGWTGTLAVGRGGSGASTLTGVLLGNGTSAFTAITGTASQYLRRNSGNTAYEFGAIGGGDVTGAALTKTDDTNVTLTLGGSSTTALLRAASLTLGWTGTLAISRGGTGLSAIGTANQLIRVNAGATALEYFTPVYALTTGTLAQFAATTSAQLAGVISDETGTGALVFGTTPTFTNSYVVQNGANSVTISVDANGNVVFTAGTNKNFHFSGDVVAFSSLTPPAANWWDSMPYATTTTVGGVKVDGTTIVINGSGVISATGTGGTSLNGTGYVKMSGTTVSYVASIPNTDLANSSITVQGTAVSLGGSVNVINGTGFVKSTGTTLSYDNSTYYLASNPNGYTTNTGTVTSVSGTGTVSGLTLSGTVTTSGSLTLGGTLSTSIDNITDEHRLFNNMGDNHGTRTSFDAATPSYNFGWRYVQGSTNGPGVNSATQYYHLYVGLGDQYAATGAGSYGMQIAIPRNVTTPYIAVRYNENNSLAAWQKISAGYADTSGNADTVDGYHETAFVRLAANSSSPTNGTFAIGTASSRNFIQSHSGQPLDINPLGNTVTIGGTGNTALHTGNYNSYSPTLAGVGATGTWGISITGTAGSETLATVTARGASTSAAVTFDGLVRIGSGLSDTAYTRIVYPGGGSYVTTASTVTGAIRIKLPTQGSAMMMTCTVKVYEYTTNKSFTITFGGHRDSANWYNEFCYLDGDNARGELTVRFGVDGGKDCIYIGETNTSWSYPQVFVTDVQLGYTGYNSTWLTGWEVGFVTTLSTVNRTQTAYRKLTPANYNSYAPSLTGTGASGTWAINVTGSSGYISGYNNPTTAATANTIVYRDSNGHITGNYILGSYFNSSAGNSENPTIGQIWTQSTGDNYLRKSTPAHFISQLSLLTASNYNSYSPTLTGTGASGTWGISITGSALRIVFSDGPRNLSDRLPNTLARSVNFDFVNSATVGGTGNYAGVMSFTPWDGTTVSTGDSSYQLGFMNETSINGAGLPGLRLRKGIDTTWGSWYTILHAGNYNSYSPTLTGIGALGTWGISITGNAATAAEAQNNYFYVRGTSPSVLFVDNDQGETRYVHHNGGSIGFLNSSGNWVLRCDNSITYGTFSGSLSGNASSASTVTINYNNDSNSNYQLLWGSGDSVYGTGGVYLNPSTDYVYAASFNASDWFRSTGDSGWYSTTHGGGIFMQDTTWVRTYNNKNFYCNQEIRAENQFTLGGGYSIWAKYGTYSSSLGRIAYISFDWNANYDIYSNHGIASTDSAGDFNDNISINSFNDITLRLDANNNNSESYVRFMNNSAGSNQFAYIGYNGSAYVAEFTGTLRATGDIIAYYSDARLKKDVKIVDSALDKLSKINGYYYKPNEKAIELLAETGDKQRIGVLAQEIAEVFPEVVEYAPFDRDMKGNSKSGEDYLTVKYERLVPVLIQAIKEQQKKIEELESKLN